MSVWLTAEQVIELSGITERHLRRTYHKLTTRAGARAANGRHQKEIALESLPPDVQARYFKSVSSRQQAVGSKPDQERSTSTIVDMPGSPHSTGETEGNAGANPAGAAANLPAAPPSNQPTERAIHESPLHGMSEENLDEIVDYAEKIKMADGKPRQQRRWIARGLKVSPSTLDRDLAAFRDHGLAALVRKPRADAGRARVADQRVVNRVQAEYLKPHRLSAKAIHRIISKDCRISGVTPPSYSFVLRALGGAKKAGKIAPDLVARFRVGEREFDNKFAYYSERERPPRPGMWVQGDHHEFDFQVVFPDGKIGRPWLTSMIDTCTSIVTGINIPRDKKVGDGRSPGSASIALALRHALLKKKDPAWPSCGLFDHLYVDLGKDYRSAHVRAVCRDLGIEIVHTRGYHGKSKAHKERWFGTLEAGLKEKNLPGYCGNKPENNPARQKLQPAPLNPKKLLTLDEFETEVRRWIVEDYHHAESKSLAGISPIEALAVHVGNGFVAREVRDERVLDLLLMRREIRKDKKGEPGIKVHRRGISLFGRFFLADELLPLIGQYVGWVAYDPADLGQVLVYKNDRLICEARNAELSRFGASAATLKREREIKQKQRDSLRERYEQIVKGAQYNGDPLAQAAAEEAYEKLEGEERRKLAVNAEPPGVSVLLPKYQQAAKQLRAPTARRGATSIRAAAKPAAAPLAEPRTKEAWEEEEPLPTGAEIFKREEKAEWEKDFEEEDL